MPLNPTHQQIQFQIFIIIVTKYFIIIHIFNIR